MDLALGPKSPGLCSKVWLSSASLTLLRASLCWELAAAQPVPSPASSASERVPCSPLPALEPHTKGCLHPGTQNLHSFSKLEQEPSRDKSVHLSSLVFFSGQILAQPLIPTQPDPAPKIRGEKVSRQKALPPHQRMWGLSCGRSSLAIRCDCRWMVMG